MTSLEQARTKVRELANKQLAIAEDPSLSDQTKIAQMDRLEPELKEARKAAQGSEALQERRARIFGATDPDTPGGGSQGLSVARKNASPLLPSGDALKQLHEAAQQHRSLRLSLDQGDDFGLKANAPEDWSGNYVPSRLLPTLQSRAESTRTAALFPQATMDTPSVEYVQVTGHTGNAAVVAPGETKPTVGINSAKQEARAVKIAGICTVEDESLDDFPDFAQVVTTEMQRSIIDAENVELLTGDGTTGHMTGLLATPGLLTRTAGVGENAADTIEQAMTDLRTGPAYSDADGVVLNPDDWSAIRRLKDSQGRYLVETGPTQAAQNRLWGVPVTLTTMCPAGQAVVGTFGLGGTVHIRRGLTVETSFNADDFARNKTTFRAEIREVLAIVRPDAFVHVTL
jgi:HK97 family phage major capsid protein